MNQSEERSRNYGEKRPLTDVSESESVLSKKARGSGDGEVRLAANVKRKSFDDFCLNFECQLPSRLVIDGERVNESVRGALEKSRRKATVNGRVRVVKEGERKRMKETKLAACCPKMSTVDKLEATK
nr:hypothetical protein [Tanacetum cinerariifolium]